MAKKKAKVTSFAEFRKKVQPGAPTCSLYHLMGQLKSLEIPSEAEILKEMKDSGNPIFKAFAEDVEREKRGEKVDFRKYSDI